MAKKKYIILILCCSLLLLLTSCKNYKKDEFNNDKFKHDGSNMIYNTYYCKNKHDSDIYYFYYVNNKLKKIDYLVINNDFDKYRRMEKDYSNVNVSKRLDNYILLEITVEKDDIRFLNENFSIFKSLDDTDFQNINNLIKFNYDCNDIGPLTYLSN